MKSLLKDLVPVGGVSEFKLNLDIHLCLIWIQQGAYFFSQKPGHLGTKKSQWTLHFKIIKKIALKSL